MPTTSNFGWTTPADTDLVKDGAAAIRTLGNGIDASLIDLKGGTTGQILAKASNTDLDYSWINNDQGDITAVTAGTGISGGGTTGAVTITNSMATAIDAKGDLIVGTGADTFDRLAVGTTNGHLLTVDSTTATGLKWAAAPVSTPSYVGVGVYKSGNQSINNSTDTALTWDTEDFDTDSFHSTSTNTSRFTIPSGKAGKYLLSGTLWWEANANGLRAIKMYKNGSLIHQTVLLSGTNDGTGIPVSFVFDLAVADYLEVFVRQSSGGALSALGGIQLTRMQLTYLGA